MNLDPVVNKGVRQVMKSGVTEPELIRLREYLANHYLVLGWLAMGSNVLGVVYAVMGRHFMLDGSFVWLFLLSGRLRAGSPSARKWAITLSVLMTLLMLVFIICRDNVLIFQQDLSQHPVGGVFLMVCSWLLYAVPGFLLLGSRGRAAFPPLENAERALEILHQECASDGNNQKTI